MMEKEPPIQTVHLFPVLDAKLMELLRSLSIDEWYKPTIAKKWLVKDIAAHLLDGNIRTLSFSRDKHPLQPVNPINNYDDLVRYLNELNAVWVNASRRMSPELLMELLAVTGKQFCDYLPTLDPFDDAIFSVAWAGEQVSKNWFHIAREYTEKFIHQQQIRDAVNRPGLITKELYYPFIDTLLQGLPHTYRHVNAVRGTTVLVSISTEAGGKWYLTRTDQGWQVSYENPGMIAASVSLDPDTAWKLFTKSISPEKAKEKAQIKGKTELAEPALQLVAVMA